jgi:hypothetical protein
VVPTDRLGVARIEAFAAEIGDSGIAIEFVEHEFRGGKFTDRRAACDDGRERGILPGSCAKCAY